MPRTLPAGAEPQPDGSTHFRVWAPDAREIAVVVEPRRGQAGRDQAGQYPAREVPLCREPDGYCSASVPGIGAGDRYHYRLRDGLAADPASRFQPDGPLGPSEVVDPALFRWTDAGRGGITLAGQVIYEMHVGTFTGPGTWRAAMQRLPDLAALGITLIEVMPIAEFPGEFGWGYDGVFPYAPVRTYGRPDDVRAFVDRAHALGLGVILDVVYNHFGPSGCVHRRFAGAYFARGNDNEWGDGLNFDAPSSGPVRDYFASNAAHWIAEYHFDGLRLDATQALHDRSDEHIIALVTARAREAAAGRSIVVVAEHERQDTRLIVPRSAGGYGVDALWNVQFASSAPFLYFADHEPELAGAVMRGRREFLAQFPSLASPEMQARIPLPHARATFERCKLDWDELELHAPQRRLHADLIALRRREAAFRAQQPIDGAVLGPEAFAVRFHGAVADDERILIVNLDCDLRAGGFPEPLLAPPDGRVWRTRWSSEHPDYGGLGVFEMATAEGWSIPGHAATVLAPAEIGAPCPARFTEPGAAAPASDRAA
jgi:1,4-alpha-glucan branching enzyme